MGGHKRSFTPKYVANHWLNTQFGWLPFISDLRKFYNTAKNLDRSMNQIKRDNGKWIRREGVVHASSKSEEIFSGRGTAHRPILVSPLYEDYNSGYHSIRLNVSQKVWCSFAFRYWIPNTESWLWRGRAVGSLFGVNLSPSLLWELTPWSWLADWVSNAGDVIDNMDNHLADNLAAKYAYVMGTTTGSFVVDSMANFRGGPLRSSWTYEFSRKKREVANPFGFGLTSNDLSARQWSILAALGISKLSVR